MLIKNKPLFILALALLLVVFIAVILTLLYKKAPPKIKPIVKGRIAIVIDDWGYHLDNLAIAGGIKQRLTCAVLPGLKNSREISQRLYKLGHEIILHLPMQPKGKLKLEKDTIAVNMSREQMSGILDKDLATVIFAKGVSNHMGSRITEDMNSSEMIMLEIKKRNLYFLDSFVTADSVCAPLARKMGIKFARRDVFLDNRDEPEYIRGQVKVLKNMAQAQGVAVGIGHDRKSTLLVLKEMLPQLEKEGYKFVFVSVIARTER